MNYNTITAYLEFEDGLECIYVAFDKSEGEWIAISDDLLKDLDNRFAIIEDDFVYFGEFLFKIMNRDTFTHYAKFIEELEPDAIS